MYDRLLLSEREREREREHSSLSVYNQEHKNEAHEMKISYGGTFLPYRKFFVLGIHLESISRKIPWH
ncbi:hypothetical protein VitviT2T_020510 [Vitis vinifera]|uniref:Uncharacterized protein n=1 Tax=Vitis vinifera TaxID=29760 RepID=A0ABY9D3Z2_VITVI|nr:hypothetical protein VitviT2T_020510 [Vitis vinifera]